MPTGCGVTNRRPSLKRGLNLWETPKAESPGTTKAMPAAGGNGMSGSDARAGRHGGDILG
jgi:hypothetical protein